MLAASSVVRLAEEAWEKPLDASDIAEEDVDSARGAIAELRRNLTAMHASTARISSKAADAAEIKAAKAREVELDERLAAEAAAVAVAVVVVPVDVGVQLAVNAVEVTAITATA